jgi:bifunctional UDP-N-acetylglucosamine pyrophosphorylase/glucosamine-1-phosphate N-acetyltransferase
MTTVIVLAGGAGRRMGQDPPKVLRKLAGLPLIESVLRSVAEIKPVSIVVVGSHRLFDHEEWHAVYKRVSRTACELRCVLQKEPLGTGDAVKTAVRSLLAGYSNAQSAKSCEFWFPAGDQLSNIRDEPSKKQILAGAESTEFQQLYERPGLIIHQDGVGKELLNKSIAKPIDTPTLISPGEEGFSGDDAINHAENSMAPSHNVIICHADTPLIQPGTLRLLAQSNHDLTVAAMRIDDPIDSMYGRLILDNGNLVGIVEAKEATTPQKQIAIANAAIYSISMECLESCINEISMNDHAKEFFFTDIVKIAYNKRFAIDYVEVPAVEATGIDTTDALYNAPVQEFLRKKLMDSGVVFQDQSSVSLSMDTKIGRGTFVGAFNVFSPGVSIGDNATIEPFCVLEDCRIGDNCSIGPFARLRGGVVVGCSAVVGNFVEVKKSAIGDNTKIKHLAYIGDATIGNKVNIGAGAVICNYDGIRKHHTEICDGASVGANASLVAPIRIGSLAFIGAGSVITKNVPDATLAIARATQQHNANWVAERSKRYKDT